MGEIGSGTGTSYPAAMDTNTTLESSSTTVRADIPNDLSAIVLKLEEVLGLSPAGSIIDVKTFLQTQHNADATHKSITTTQTITTTVSTGTSPLTVSSTTVCTNLNAEQHNGLKVKVVDIGPWNMDSSDSSSVTHGLTLANIRSVNVLIRNDVGTVSYPIFGIYNNDLTTITSADADATYSSNEVTLINEIKSDFNTMVAGMGAGYIVTGTTVQIERKTLGFFDNTAFSTITGSYNRGWITIWYV